MHLQPKHKQPNNTSFCAYKGKTRWLFTICVVLLLCVPKHGASQTSGTRTIKCNGVYTTNPIMDSTTASSYYLRFYPDGKVITVNSTGTPDQIKGWFNFSMQNLDSGTVTIKGSKIRFSATAYPGTVKYWGKIRKNGSLRLRCKSFNGYKGKEKYYFVPLQGLR